MPNPDLLGMVIRDPWYDGTFPGQPDLPNQQAQDRMGAMLAQTGVRWVRLEFHIEGSDALSATQVARNDYFINEVAPRYNLKVLGLLGFGLLRGSDPRNLTLTNTLRLDPLYGGGVNDFMKTWLDRARLIADRYQGRVGAYEVLNEQNRLPPNGQPGVGGDAIPASIAARLHTKFYRFFKQEDAKAPGQEWRSAVPVIVGGLHPGGTGTFGKPGFVSDIDYLKQLYASDGFQAFKSTNTNFPLDGVGYHPYPEEIRRSRRSVVDQYVLPRMNDVRAAIDSFYVVPFELPPQFWITEIGYNAAFASQTEAGQAEFMRDVYTQMATRGDVATVFWFKYEDFPGATPTSEQWGIVRIPFTIDSGCPGGACYDPSGQPSTMRAAYLVYRDLAGMPVYRVQLPLVGQ
ncbi:MAG: hypothetical protein H7Y32_17110 [Chloroflexales bacterium]|nr:hypothetical protein [Chloroflexales bacterium]